MCWPFNVEVRSLDAMLACCRVYSPFSCRSDCACEYPIPPLLVREQRFEAFRFLGDIIPFPEILHRLFLVLVTMSAPSSSSHYLLESFAHPPSDSDRACNHLPSGLPRANQVITLKTGIIASRAIFGVFHSSCRHSPILHQSSQEAEDITYFAAGLRSLNTKVKDEARVPSGGGLEF
jgi:hypothetical protein